MSDILLVLEARVLEQLGVERDVLVQMNRPWPRVGLGIVDGDLDLEPSVRRTTEAFGDGRGVGQRAAVEVGPQPVTKPLRLHDERVLLPLPRRITAPRRVG